MTAAQLIEAARIVDALDLPPRRIVSFFAEGSEGVYLRIDPETLHHRQLTWLERRRREQHWLIARDGHSMLRQEGSVK
jgi:hypothetical protein